MMNWGDTLTRFSEEIDFSGKQLKKSPIRWIIGVLVVVGGVLAAIFL